MKLFYFACLIAFALSAEAAQISKVSSCSTNNSTVCLTENGEQSCCPVKNGICCQNTNYCCPNGFSCDSDNKRCINKNENLFMPFHLSTSIIEDNNVELASKEILCPDNETSCSERQTCCILGDQFGCCPLFEAVCCDDKIHCCPKNYVCNPSQGKCDRKLGNSEKVISVNWFVKEKGMKKKQLKKNDLELSVVCPGGASQCPDGTTCCQLSSGEYGCCPLPNAVCCSDHLHCCPSGYTCDVADGRCNKGDVSLPFYQKIKASPRKAPVSNVVCPGGESECPTGTTCCQLSTGDYGCCPFPNAVCCSDKLHCCPSGYTCDVSDGRCNKNDISIPFYKKTNSIPKLKSIQKVTCPGGASECPDGTTCCQLSTGDYGCCPLPNAVCCSDHLHCCPSGYTCDVKDGRCNKGDISLPFYEKFEAFKKEKRVENKDNSILCPDGGSFCPNDNTCCKLADGSYGCCPLPKAVCCQDNLHCCPENSQCDLAKQTCVQSAGESKHIPWYKKVSAKLLFNKKDPKKPMAPLLCKDNSTLCDPMKTCCQNSDKTYGCCSYTDGVCCNDFCCPSNSVCGKKKGECLIKMMRITSQENSAPNLSTDSCPSNTTQCVRQSDQANVCCPYDKGECCGPHGYCCPKGYTCNADQESCELNDGSNVEKIEKIEPQLIIKDIVKIKLVFPSNNTLIRRKLLENDPSDCNDNIHYCEDGHTCCTDKKTQSYGCCPLDNAICCSNGINCCPNGYSCGTGSSITCTKKNNYN